MQVTTSPARYRAIGLMSGSSLDGLDIACCDFEYRDGCWIFHIPHATCAPYDDILVQRLRNAHTMSGKDMYQLHADFGHFSGQAVKDFIEKNDIQNVMLAASHGHTIFHFPQLGFTTQIGDGAAIAAKAGLPVICDFRSSDVAKGGNGAPLVPIGDHLLFNEYRFLLNIGGIVNLTINDPDETIAFDIGCANQILNTYAQKLGHSYDDQGKLAEQGSLNQPLFDRLNELDYYHLLYPKSLDNGYSRDVILPLVDEFNLSPYDVLHTYCEHLAFQIAKHLQPFQQNNSEKILITGGGALNKYLVERIAHYTRLQIAQADNTVINYKEALIFALMGVLRWREETNIYPTVTGAKAPSIAGAIYLP